MAFAGSDQRLRLSKTAGDRWTFGQPARRRGWRQRNDAPEAGPSRPVPERAITTKTHAEDDDRVGSPAFQRHRGRIGVFEAVKISLVVNPGPRPAHFRPRNQKARPAHTGIERRELCRRPLLAMHQTIPSVSPRATAAKLMQAPNTMTTIRIMKMSIWTWPDF